MTVRRELSRFSTNGAAVFTADEQTDADVEGVGVRCAELCITRVHMKQK